MKLAETQENNDIIDWMTNNKRAARVAHALKQIAMTLSSQQQREFSKCNGLPTKWTQNRKSFFLDIFFNGVPTCPF